MLGGANAVVVLGDIGVEIVQFHEAEVVGPSLWRLSGLLRGQQGTEGEMWDGAEAGTVVVFLDADLPRASVSRGEIGLPLIWRAGPSGAPPGGAGITEQSVVLTGVRHRPWSPAHLKAVRTGAGVAVSWISRTRTNGDVWDGEPPLSDPLRFRIRVTEGALERRRMEVEGTGALYAAADLASDFPAGVGGDARMLVAQANAFSAWGVEASVSIPI